MPSMNRRSTVVVGGPAYLPGAAAADAPEDRQPGSGRVTSPCATAQRDADALHEGRILVLADVGDRDPGEVGAALDV